ncbi:hypothetical protein C5167_034280 [Papaver somniferum]|uniref:Uncharacterized protein n=1 Tax=Papaver somniferum TaxID=3469 RepID=A0A4Y7KFE9_PAPSO|nr:hypothetical protein C5167_034280 [Papaver somniferum]
MMLLPSVHGNGRCRVGCAAVMGTEVAGRNGGRERWVGISGIEEAAVERPRCCEECVAMVLNSEIEWVLWMSQVKYWLVAMKNGRLKLQLHSCRNKARGLVAVENGS